MFHDLGRVRELKDARPDLIIGVGGCVASAGRRGDRAPRALRRRRVRPADAAPAARADPRAARRPAARRSTSSFPEIEKFDAPAAAARRRRLGVRVDHGGLQQVLHVLRRALHARRGGVAAVRRRADRGRRPRAAGRDGGDAARAERQRVPRPPADGSGIADFATLLEHVAEIPGIERIRYTTSHPTEMSARLIDVYRDADKLVSQLHLPVQSGSDRVLAAMKRGYTALEYKSIVRRLRAARPDLSLRPRISSSASPARPTPTSSRRCGSVDDVRLRRRVQLPLQRRVRARRPRSWPIRCRATSRRRGSRGCRRCSRRSTARSDAMVGSRQRVLVTGPRGQGIRASSPPAPTTIAS